MKHWKEMMSLRTRLNTTVKSCIYNPAISFGERAKMVCDSGLHASEKHRLFTKLLVHENLVEEGDKVYGGKRQLVSQLSATIEGRAFLVLVQDKSVEIREFDVETARRSGKSPHGSKKKSDALRSPVTHNYITVYKEELCL